MLRKKVSIYDILDCEAFVIMCIKRSGAQVQPNEYEDMVAEGLCILISMSQRYEPHRPGYAQPGRFSGYAIKYLPRKMKEAWHRAHEEHLQRTQADGRRRYEYHDRASSLNGYTQDGDEQNLRLPGNFVSPPRRDVLEDQSQ